MLRVACFVILCYIHGCVFFVLFNNYRGIFMQEGDIVSDDEEIFILREYEEEMIFELIKSQVDGRVIGFIIASQKLASDKVKYFCCQLMSFLDKGLLNLAVRSTGKSMVIFKDNMYERTHTINFPIGEDREISELKDILNNQEIELDRRTITHNEGYGIKLIAQ